MVRRIVGYVIGGVAVLFALAMCQAPQPLHAQTSFGTIVGTVTDPSQAAIPDVAITVTNTQTGITRKLQTDAVGNYRVESLLPGVYTVKAEKPGFQVTDVTAVTVPVAVIVTVNIVMPVGAVTQTVEVTAAAPLLQTASATVGTVVNNTSVVTLPLNGRNFTELVSLIPGSVSSGGAIYQIAGGSNYSVSGNRAEQNNFTLDGAYNNEEMFKTYGIQPSIDAIQEFKIQTNITSAEFGQAAGANVNVATKSGTNALHGSVFEFLRNNHLDAVPWFRNASTTLTQEQKANPQYKRNNYGFTAGGPVYLPKVYDGRDRTFWFFDYEATKVRQGSSTVGRLPTTAMLNGDFSGQKPIYDPTTTRAVGTNPDGTTRYARDQFSCNGVANVICPDRLSPWVSDYMKVFYPSNFTNAAPGAPYANYINSSPFAQDAYQWHTRVDQKIRDNLSFFSRFSLADATQNSVQAVPNLYSPLINNFRNAVASWTLVANPTTVIDWKVAFNRTNIQTWATNPAPGWEAFLQSHPISGTPVKSTRTPLFPQLQDNTGTFSMPYQEAFPFVENEYQVMGSISKIKGKHTIKAGMEFLDFRSLDDGNFTSLFYFDPSPTVDPQNVAGSGNVMAAMMLGLPIAGARNLGETQFYARQIRVQPYLQDDIKLTRKLTVNLGLRYEYNQWPVERWDRIAGFDPTSGTRSPATPNGGAYLWGGKNPITGQGPNARRAIRDPDFNNFAPRVGMAYQITPNTTFRGGYGIFYVSNYMWEDQGARGNWPYAVSQTLSGVNTSTYGPNSTNPSGINTPVGLVPITNFFTPDVLPGPDSAISSQHVLGRLDRTTYAQQWNAGIQRMLTSSLMLEVDYVGSRTVKGSLFANLNTAPPGPGVIGTDKHRIYGDSYGAMSLMTNQASSTYNSMQIKVEKRFSNGLQFLSSYAWGHQLDIGNSAFSASASPQNPDNWAADKANGQFDYRHIWAFSYFYQLPFGKGRKYMSNPNPVVNGVLGGWELSGIVHYQSGYPINVGYPTDNANIGPRAGAQRPDWVGGQPRTLLNPNDRTIGWLNQANYAPPQPFAFGTAGRNLERGPGAGYFNPALLKNFPVIGEKMTLQFRAEFFNFFNQHAMACIGSSYGASNFGVASCTQQGSREVQFGLKVLF
jgi:hypothetical protein